MVKQGKNSSAMVFSYHFVADDTVESLISFTGFHYQEGSYGIEDGESATAATVPIILASKQLKIHFKTRRLFKN
jgi:hypothetical protein